MKRRLARRTLRETLRLHPGPLHACWFAHGPEHFAAVVGGLVEAVLWAGERCYVIAPAAFAEALTTRLRSARVPLDRLSVWPGPDASPARDELAVAPPGGWIVHVVGAAGRMLAGRRSHLEGWERTLHRLTEADRFRVLCVYDLATVEAWQSDCLAESIHPWLVSSGRLHPFRSLLARPPQAGSLPAAPARSEESGAGVAGG